VKKILLFILFVIGLNTTGFADVFFNDDTSPIFQVIGREEGLKNLSVSNILQDKNGYIWFATQGGLYKYNGESCVAYRNDPFETSGLIHNLVQTMYYDEDAHSLWLGTYQGISMLDIATNQFTNYTVPQNGLSNSVVTAIARDKSGNLWCGTMDGLNRLNPSTGKFITYSVDGDVVRSLLLDSQGRLLVGTYEGLYIFDESRDGLTKVDIDYPSPYVMVVREFTPGVITLGMWDGGVLELDMDFKRLAHYSYDDNRVYTIKRTSDGTLWTGTWGGGLFAAKDGKVYAFPGSGVSGDLDHGVVYSLFEDNVGILWIGTNGGGVYKANPREGNYLIFYNNPDDPTSLDAGKMNCIYRDRDDRLWISVYNKGLNRYDPDQKVMIKYNSKNEQGQFLPNDQVMDFVESGDTMYVASGDGVCAYNPSLDNFELMNIMPEEMITYALEIDKDGELWVGTYLNGIYHFDKDMTVEHHFNINNLKYRLSDNLIYDILADKKGRIWIASNNGLNVYDKTTDQLKTYSKEQGNYEALASNSIRRLFEDSTGALWVGMYGGGIAKYIEGTDTFINFTESDGLLDNSVISINEGNNGTMWIASHNGVSLIDPDSYAITHITSSAAVENENYTGHGWTDDDGSIYLGGIYGITRFPASQTTKNNVLPPLYITDVLQYNTTIDQNIDIYNGKNFDFAYDENYISFEFEALDYEGKAQMQYYYNLSNVDSDWVNSSNRRFASYSNLKPGHYVFTVKAKTFNGLYTHPVDVSFTIEKPWYRTVYAYLLYLLLVGLMVYIVIKIKESHLIAERNSELAKLNGKLEDAVNELENVSIKDPLTGIYNRRYLDTVFYDHLELAKRGNNYLSLLMVDIDDFKLINDKYGHVAGDEFLIAFAQVLQSQLLRSTDFVARYGGDEFAIVLYDTDPSGTSLLADRVLNAIRTSDSLQGVSFSGMKTFVSIGVYSVKPDSDMTIQEFISKADGALYEAKTSGKNRVVIR
jgi:diguanylate cyclase (GGDEF)-like protein